MAYDDFGIIIGNHIRGTNQNFRQFKRNWTNSQHTRSYPRTEMKFLLRLISVALAKYLLYALKYKWKYWRVSQSFSNIWRT
jgi:hypothetical protein